MHARCLSATYLVPPAALLAAALLGSCVERRVDPEIQLPVRAESIEVPIEIEERDLGAIARMRLRRLHELVQQGLHEEAKAELARLSEEPEAAEFLETLERWDRYLDGCIAWQSLHGVAKPVSGERLTAGKDLELDLELFTASGEPVEIPAGGIDQGEYRGGDESSFFKLRLTEVLFDGLGAHSSTVQWETVPLQSPLACAASTIGRMRHAIRQPEATPWALKLLRIDATLYPCAALVGTRYVPLRPVAFAPAVVAIYPNGWNALAQDPLLALRAACSSEDPVFDRHALIAASLLPRGGDEERKAFEFLQVASTQSAPRVRAKAGAALEWLRLDRAELWAEATRLAPTRAKQTRRSGDKLDLPRR
ncbi:MAG: hypothetical protein IPN34_01450 [Planctomycetes bacterium]|nr:hypothetical protein [Planctomycetota bacterium]